METVLFKTLGCKLNQIETESLAQAFSEAGFRVYGAEETEDESSMGMDPALCIVNTCTVTGKAEQKARRLIRLLLRSWPSTTVLVTGCYAEVEEHAISAIDPRVLVLPGKRKNELASLPSFINTALLTRGNADIATIVHQFIQDTHHEAGAFRLSTDNFRFHSRASIKIQDGCNNRCAYCRICLARGASVSLPADEVISRIKEIEQANWAEVVLTGVNLSQYRSGDGDFAQLLSSILAQTKHIAIRISSLYPDRVDSELVPLLNNPRIRPHFHLSVQSGSEKILSAMRRPYHNDQVLEAVHQLRLVKDDPFIACDIITGFPGETDEDFDQTLEMCLKAHFAWIHAFPFSPRPGTEAWTMGNRVPERIAGDRVKVLTDLAHANLEAYSRRWIGKTVKAVIEKSSGQHQGQALTENYLTVSLDELCPPRGTSVVVELIDVGKARLIPQ